VGAFVKKNLAAFTSIIEDISDHRIMWLQILTKKEALFIAVVYVSPNNLEDLREVLENVETNLPLLTKCGKVVIMGDLNGRMGNVTGDKITNERGRMIKKLSKNMGVKIVRAKQDKKWTFYSKVKGESIIDLILLREGDKHSVSNYMVHKNISFGSDHRLVTFDWNLWDSELFESKAWPEEIKKVINWSESNIQEYQVNLKREIIKWNNELMKPGKQAQGEKVMQFVEILQKSSLPLCKKIGNGNSEIRESKFRDESERILKQRNDLIHKIDAKQSMETRLELTRKVSDMQKAIIRLEQEEERKQHQLTWNKIINMKSSLQTKMYWSMVKKLRKGTKVDLPQMINAEDKRVISKIEIVEEFAKSYKRVYDGVDQEAHDYHKINQSHENSIATGKARKKIMKQFNQVLDEKDNLGGLPDLDDSFSAEEIVIALKETKKGTTGGEDNITVEMLVNGGKIILSTLKLLFDDMWSSGKTPEELQNGLIIPVFKGGDGSRTKNYRPITLLSCLFKLYEKVLEKRLRKVLEASKAIPDIQKGATPNVGSSEALFTILSAIECNSDKPTTLAFMDLSKAYDRVWREGLWVKLKSLGVKGRLLRAVMSTYSNPEMKVSMGGLKSQSFLMSNGLRQGSVLSPLLFITLFTDPVRVSCTNKGLLVPTENGEEEIKSQCFVDDTVLMTEEPESIMGQINGFNAQAAIWGSVLNLHKTKIISNRNLTTLKTWMTSMGINTEKGQSKAKYLGIWASVRPNSCLSHYQFAVAKARSTIRKLKAVGVRVGCIQVDEGLDLLRKLVWPQIAYAAEVLCPSESVIKMVNEFLRDAIKEVMPVHKECDPSVALWESGMDDFEMILIKAKLKFHFKICDGSKPSGVRKYYVQDNYLRKEIDDILTKLKLSVYSPEFITKESGGKKPFVSKGIWKNIVTKGAERDRKNRLRAINPRIISLKGEKGLEEWMKQVSVGNLRAFLNTRHDMWGRLTCQCDSIERDEMVKHFLAGCSNVETIISRIAMKQGAEALVGGFKLLDAQDQLQIMLGKMPPKGVCEDLWKVRAPCMADLTATFVNENMTRVK
jgi:hypothetical protein